MIRVTVRCAQASGMTFNPQIPEFLLELERMGIQLNKPFTLRVDTMLGVIDAEQNRD